MCNLFWGIGKGSHLILPIGPKNINLVEDVKILLPVKFGWIPKSKMSQPIRGQGGHLSLPTGLKNSNFVEDVKILLPVKFRWIPFSSFRGEVENVSVNQRSGRPSCISDWSEKHKLGRGCLDLASDQVSLNPVKRFRGEFENVSANQRPGRPSCFSDRHEKHKLCRGR